MAFFLCRCHKVKKDHWGQTVLWLYSQLHSNKKQDITAWVGLDFEVDPIVVLQVWIIQEPVPPFPKRGCHFVQKFALCFVTEHVLSQPLPSGRFFLPQFLFVAGLCTPENSKSALKPCFFNGFNGCKRFVPCVWSKGRSATSWTFRSQTLRTSSCLSLYWSTSAFCLMAESHEEEVLTHCNMSENQSRQQERSMHSNYKTIYQQRKIFYHHRYVSDR